MIAIVLLGISFVAFGKSLDPYVKSRLAHFAQHAYSTREPIYNSYELVVDCIKRHIPGDIVEYGVAVGVQVAAMGFACQQEGDKKRKIYLYDSFEGIPFIRN